MQTLLNNCKQCLPGIPGLFLFVSLLLCSGCNNYLYVPADGNLLALDDKGDMKVGAGLNLIGDYRTYAVQAGYSPIKHLGVKGQFFHLNKVGEQLDNQTIFFNGYSDNIGKGYMGEASVGGYLVSRNWRNDDKKDDKYLMPLQSSYDAYIGYGQGQVNNTYTETIFNGGVQPSYFLSGDSKLDFRKYFLQIGTHLNLHSIGLNFGIRGTMLDYTKAQLNGRVPEYRSEDVYTLQAKDPVFALETSFRFQVGIKHARMYLSGVIVRTSEELHDVFLPAVFQWGTVFDLDEMFRKKTKQPNTEDF